MEESGPVTLSQIERAIGNLGGEAPWDKILDELTSLRNGDYSHYHNKRNYKNTAFQVIQRHCRGYKKYTGPTRFEHIGNSYRLLPQESISSQHSPPAQEKHTPRAIDIEDVIQPERLRQETYRILRDTALARTVKESRRYRCQICGHMLFLADSTPYAEAHHIMPLGVPHNGPDVRENILCVCPNDHVLLDYGAIQLDDMNLEGIGKEFVAYHNEKIYRQLLV